DGMGEDGGQWIRKEQHDPGYREQNRDGGPDGGMVWLEVFDRLGSALGIGLTGPVDLSLRRPRRDRLDRGEQLLPAGWDPTFGYGLGSEMLDCVAYGWALGRRDLRDSGDLTYQRGPRVLLCHRGGRPLIS